MANRVDDPKYADVLKSLRAELFTLQKQVGDTMPPVR
jgi:hypothetical protein